MINLLPPEEKQKFILENREKLVIILGSAVLISLICLTLLLLSTKFYILTEADTQKGVLAEVSRQYQTPEALNLSSAINKYNATLDQLDSFYKKEIYFDRALETITSVSGAGGLRLTNFSLGRDSSGTVRANILGTSDTRENLLSFKKNIEARKDIKSPYFSPESWTKPKSANFSLTFIYDGKQ